MPAIPTSFKARVLLAQDSEVIGVSRCMVEEAVNANNIYSLITSRSIQLGSCHPDPASPTGTLRIQDAHYAFVLTILHYQGH